MEQYNLSWTLWMQKMVLGKSWRHLGRAATMDNHRCLRSSVCMCTHVHAWFQTKYVTRNKSYAKGKAWSWPRHDSFILNPKLGWSLADGHKHSHQSTEVSTNVVRIIKMLAVCAIPLGLTTAPSKSSAYWQPAFKYGLVQTLWWKTYR